MPPTKVLVVEDELDMLLLLQEWLQDAGYDVYTAGGAREALEAFPHLRPTLTITDLRMPGMDGFQLIQRIREMSDAYVLALTALDSEEHMIRGLELGADEYLVKPVPRRVFLSRIQSIMRRAERPDDLTAYYSDGYLSINFLAHEANVRGTTLHLRPTEFRILAVLTRHSDRVVQHDELLERVWGDRGGSLDSLKWYISALRQKLEENPSQPRLIITVPRVGYRYYRPDSQQIKAPMPAASS